MNPRLLFLVLAYQVAVTFQASEQSMTYNSKRPTNPLWRSTWKDKLKQDLLLHYDKFARPLHEGNVTTVSMDMALRHIEMDEKKSIMIIHCWMKMNWNDDKIRWNSTDYGGLKELHMAEHEVWQPDVFPYNSAAGNTVDHFGNTNLIGYYNGSVLWVPPSIFKVFCPMDFTKWPFDIQTCSLKIGSWTYNGEQIDFTNPQAGTTSSEVDAYFNFQAPDLVPSSVWKFVKMTVERNSVSYPCCSVPYIDLTFNVTVQRQSATYRALIVTPTVAIVLMTLASFLLPPTLGDKVTLTGAAAIINCMILLFFMYMMPSMAGGTPYIVSFYSITMYLVSFAIAISAVVYNLAKNPKLTPLPWILKKNLTGCLGKCLFINVSDDKEKLSKAEEMTDSQQVLSDQERHQRSGTMDAMQRDWVLLATALDRIFFIIYSLIFLIMALIYSM